MKSHEAPQRDKDVITVRNITAPARRRLLRQQGSCARWPVAITMAGLMLSGLPLAVAANDPPGLTLTPLFNASTQQDDAATHSLEEQDPTWMNLVDAGMALRFDAPGSGWELRYEAEAARHELEAEKKYVDHSLSGRGLFRLGDQHSLEIRANLDVTEDDKGKTRSRGVRRLLQRMDSLARTEVGVMYQFGSESSQEPLHATVTYSGLDYQNHDDSSSQAFGYSEDYVAGAFSLRLVPATALLLEVSRLEVAYGEGLQALPTRANTRDSIATGLSWQTSANTSGSVKLGYLQRTFDTRQQETFAIPSWELRLAWTPDARSTLKVESQRFDRETTAGDDIIDTRSYRVNWTRRWNDQWSMQVAGTYLDEVYGRVHREQNTVQLNTAVHYAMQQRIKWSLGYRWRDRDSNIEHLRLGQNRLEFRATIPI